jgi:hypothetical protein
MNCTSAAGSPAGGFYTPTRERGQQSPLPAHPFQPMSAAAAGMSGVPHPGKADQPTTHRYHKHQQQGPAGMAVGVASAGLTGRDTAQVSGSSVVDTPDMCSLGWCRGMAGV